MWLLAKWTLGSVVFLGIYQEFARYFFDGTPADDGICPWDNPILPDNPTDFMDFGPWKGRKEDEWIIGGALLFIILQSKFWK